MTARTAHAGVPVLEDGRVLSDGPAMELGVKMVSGESEWAQRSAGLEPTAQGIVIRDRNGMSSRMVLGLVIAIAGAAAQSGPKSVTSESHVEGDYLVTTTTTTYYTEEEKEQMRKNTNAAIDGLFKMKNSDFELELYSRDRFGQGDSSGFKTNFMAGTGKSVVFETGFGFGSIDSEVIKGGVTNHIHWGYFGMPFRLSWPMGKARGELTWEWNWLGYGKEVVDRAAKMNDDGSISYNVYRNPWHLDVQAAVLGRLSLTAGVIMPAIKHPDFGYELSIAGRF